MVSVLYSCKDNTSLYPLLLPLPLSAVSASWKGLQSSLLGPAYSSFHSPCCAALSVTHSQEIIQLKVPQIMKNKIVPEEVTIRMI